jgi:hypothetical protein
VTEDRKRPRPEDYFSDWKEREALAEAMIPVVGTLSRERNVKCYIYGRSLVNQSVLDIMKSHRWVRQMEANELSEFETAPVLGCCQSAEPRSPATSILAGLLSPITIRAPGRVSVSMSMSRKNSLTWWAQPTSLSMNQSMWCFMDSVALAD